MKKIKLSGKLSLNKETIAKLNDEQMGSVKGGDFTSIVSCINGGSKCCPAPSGISDQACSCISCTGDLCNTCAVC